MRVERQVTDIIIAVIATYFTFLFNQFPDPSATERSAVYIGVGIVSLNFIHIILSQLNYFERKESTIFSYICSILIIILFTMYLLTEFSTLEGYWTNLNFGLNDQTVFNIINYILFFILGISAFLSRDAELM